MKISTSCKCWMYLAALSLVAGVITQGTAAAKPEEKHDAKVEHKEVEAVGGKFGAHMAVTAFDKEEGFKLSERGIASLGVLFHSLNSGHSWQIPKTALVTFKHSTAVYRRVEGWISLVLVKVLSNEGDNLKISSEDLQAGDEIAISGTQFLRMTDLDLNSDTVDTCSH